MASTLNSLIDYTSLYTYEFIIARALSRVDDALDKRQGSVIYDALAPSCQELANAYVEFQSILNQTFALTAEGEYLDMRVAEGGLVRNPATYSTRKAEFVNDDLSPATLEIGTRFSTIDDVNPIYYTITAEYEENDVAVPGSYQVTCETLGEIGNEYIGNIVPLEYVAGLKSAYMDEILIPGEEVESDDDLRLRYFQEINNRAFGGNITQYREWAQKIDGVGPVQVYPIWNGGGTVKLSILDTTYSQASNELIDIVQQQLDPDNFEGTPVEQGLGLGTAPIGHVVTVTTGAELTITVAATVVFKTGYNVNQIKPLIQANLATYFETVRKNWGTSDELNTYQVGIYIAKVISTILNTEGVENVQNDSVLLNGSNSDIILTETKTTQQIPILGTVTINGV